jgi:hypothetical protein
MLAAVHLLFYNSSLIQKQEFHCPTFGNSESAFLTDCY